MQLCMLIPLWSLAIPAPVVVDTAAGVVDAAAVGGCGGLVGIVRLDGCIVGDAGRLVRAEVCTGAAVELVAMVWGIVVTTTKAKEKKETVRPL